MKNEGSDRLHFIFLINTSVEKNKNHVNYDLYLMRSLGEKTCKKTSF